MGIEWFRDLIICILGIITIVVSIFIAFVAYAFYRRSRELIETMHLAYHRLNSILDKIETTSEAMRIMASDIKEAMLNPVSQIISIIQGMRQGMSLVNKFFGKKEVKENE